VLLSVRINGDFGQSKVLEVERVVSATAGKCVVSDESHNDASRQQAGEQFFVGDVIIPRRNSHRLARHSSHGKLGRSRLQRFGVTEEHRRRQFHFSHVQHGVFDVDFLLIGTQQAERVGAFDEFQLHVHLVDQIAILKH